MGNITYSVDGYILLFSSRRISGVQYLFYSRLFMEHIKVIKK